MSGRDNLTRRRSWSLRGLARRLIPIAKPKLTKKTAVDDPLLQVPPARRGNRACALRGSPRVSGGNLKEGGQLMNFGRAVGKCPCAVFSTQRATTRVAPTEARRHQPCRAGLVPARFACCNHIAKTPIIPHLPDTGRRSATVVPQAMRRSMQGLPRLIPGGGRLIGITPPAPRTSP